MTDLSPERIAAMWAVLEEMAALIADAETRARYLADWRQRYEETFPRWLGEASIVRLPDWKHLGKISDRERRQANRVSDAWIAEQDGALLAEDIEAAKRFAWELGRRVAGGLIEEAAAQVIQGERLGAMVSTNAVIAAWRRGRGDVASGQGLVAAIVLDLRCAQHPRTGKGLALRFRDRFGHDFRHTTAKGWLRWDGMRWKVLEEERGVVPAELMAAAMATIDGVQREGKAVRATGVSRASIPEGVDPEKFLVEVDGRKIPLFLVEDNPDGLDGLVITPSTCRLASDALARFGRAREEATTIKGVADMARNWMTARIQDFDTDPMVINCRNGTLRLVREDGPDGVECRAVLHPHERTDLLTKIAAVDYDPDAVCPHYDGTIEWAQPSLAMRRYLHQWGGYNLTGDMGAQIFHIWWGPLAQNGKSTILDAWADCAGDYAEAGKIETFMEAAQRAHGDAATPALAMLPGVRMLRTGEPPDKAKFDESLINAITGQDTMQIRELNRGFYAVKLAFKLTVACNAPPRTPNATEGIKRRVKVVPFEKSMKGALRPDGTPLRDEKFAEKLRPEMPGVFARLIEGALDWLRCGFVEPEDVTRWTEEYKDENDPLGRFLAYCVVQEDGARTQASVMHKLFQAWSKATGGPDWTMPFFKSKMVAKGFSDKRSNGMQWIGLKVIHNESEFVDAQGNVKDLTDTPDAYAGGAASARVAVRDGPPGDAPPPDEFDDPDYVPF